MALGTLELTHTERTPLCRANVLAYIVCAFTALNGFFNGYVMCVHPAFRTGELSATGDPTHAYSGGEGEMLAYLKANPQLAAKAGAVAVKFAHDNPDVARAAIQGSAGGGSKATATAPAAAGGPQAGGDVESNPWG